MKHLLGFILLLASTLPHGTSAQYRSEAGPARLGERVTQAAGEVFRWYDAPVFLVYAVNRYQVVEDDDKPVQISVSPLERLLSRSIAVPGSESPGSIHPFTLPHLLLGARAVHIAAVELFDDDGNAGDELRLGMGLYRSLMYTQVATQAIKHAVHRTRPDGSDDKSFVSGHASVAFAFATWVRLEASDAIRSNEWLRGQPVWSDALHTLAWTACYGWASYVGYSRMRDNKHYLGDVLAGAALGTVMSVLVYSDVTEQGLPFLDGIGFTSIDGVPGVALHVSF